MKSDDDFIMSKDVGLTMKGWVKFYILLGSQAKLLRDRVRSRFGLVKIFYKSNFQNLDLTCFK